MFDIQKADLHLLYSPLTVNKIARDRCMSPWITVFTSKKLELICHVSSAAVTNHVSPCITGDDKLVAIKLRSGRIESSASTCPVQVTATGSCQLTLTGLLAKHSQLCTNCSKLLSADFTFLVHRHAVTRKHQLASAQHVFILQLCSKEVRFIQQHATLFQVRGFYFRTVLRKQEVCKKLST